MQGAVRDCRGLLPGPQGGGLPLAWLGLCSGSGWGELALPGWWRVVCAACPSTDPLERQR